MDESSLPQHIARSVGASPLSEKVARAQEVIYGPVIDWARRSPFHTGVLGHSIHPLLTDVTLGCWLSASILDLGGGAQSRSGATLLVGTGVVAAVPTAISGAGDWAGMEGPERRIAAVHALGTDIAVFLHLGSLIARRRGRFALGTGLGLAGNVVVAGSGFLGGHLALDRGTARRTGSHDDEGLAGAGADSPARIGGTPHEGSRTDGDGNTSGVGGRGPLEPAQRGRNRRGRRQRRVTRWGDPPPSS
ncbi:DUF2231 domain-containing protein [Arthrobacter sp. TMS1-12-1]